MELNQIIQIITTLLSSILVTGTGLAWLWGRIDKKFEKVDQRFEKVDLSIKEVRTELKADIQALESRMNTRFEKLETDMNTRFEKVDQRFEKLERQLQEIPKIKFLVMNIQWGGKIPRDIINKELLGDE